MRYRIGLLAVTAIVVLIGLAAHPERASTQPSKGRPSEASSPAVPSGPSFAPDQILVKTKEDAPPEATEEINRRNNARTKKKIPRTRVSVVKLPEDLPVPEAVKRYEASPDIEYAEPDYKVYPTQSFSPPNDADYPKLYGLNNTGQFNGTPDADIDAPEAWNLTTGDASVVVAVIDTGVDVSHPDLKNNIWVNTSEIPGNGIDDDNNSYVDDVNGWDFRNNDNSVFDSANDDAHGTHVAGTIAAEGNNSTGVTGVNWRAKIMPLKFSSAGTGYVSDAVEALNYAVAKGVKISNNSWGGGGYSQTLLDAIKRADAAGHLFVAAAGNGGADGTGDDNDAIPQYPASYDAANIVSVAATDQNDALTSFSNYGATSVDLAAPGKSVLSTLPNNAYGYYSGTSMAAPHVSGVAALIKSRVPTLDDDGIKARILESVDRKTDLSSKTVSGGRLNASKAFTTLGENAPPPIATPVGNAPPTITDLHPLPDSKTRDRTPTISATVRDEQTDLTKSNISLYLDERQITNFAYDQAKDKLTYTSTKLSRAQHTVKVVATDAQGASTTKTWSFKVVRRR